MNQASSHFLPIRAADMKDRGWSQLDIILISGDAYVDHPSFAVAVIGRVLENAGYRVGIIAQPNCQNLADITRLGKPRLFFGLTSGNVDSMVVNYTANKRLRKEDAYSPGGISGKRPDRALIVYANLVKRAYKDAVIVLGGIEASMRRFAHYDYWDHAVRRSILLDSRADILVYGMGEKTIVEVARQLEKNSDTNQLNSIKGTVVVRQNIDFLAQSVIMPAYEEIKEDKNKFNQAFMLIYQNQNPFSALPLIQPHQNRFVIQFPPPLPHLPRELDQIYSLPYQRHSHPIYKSMGGIKALDMIRHSITSHRGCIGQCHFCSLYMHQGRIIQSRTPQSIVKEVERICADKDFRGTISDIGGPTVNMYLLDCPRWRQSGFCSDRHCLLPQRCPQLKDNQSQCLALYRRVRSLSKVKHLFLSSGFRYDLFLNSQDNRFLEEICRFYISGQMKVAPEHTANSLLRLMNKPSIEKYLEFEKRFNTVKRKIGRSIFLVNYFISAHPGCSHNEITVLINFLRARNLAPQQIQDFIPLPMTASACMYFTGRSPFTGESVYIPRSFKERKQQRRLIQPWTAPE